MQQIREQEMRVMIEMEIKKKYRLNEIQERPSLEEQEDDATKAK
jgi:hypothetical protein